MGKEKTTKKRKKKWLKRIIILLIVLLILAFAAYLAVQKLKQEYTVTYDTYTASIGTISNSLSFSGSLQLVDNVTYTADGSATIRDVYVKEGDKVYEGQKLMKLSNGQMVEAEFDGKVNQLYVAANEKVTAGTSLVQVADFEHMYVSIRVDEYDINDVAVGQNCRVTATATEKEFTAAIDSINYISSSAGNVAYYTATAYVDVEEGIYPGMQVTVTIPQQEAENVVVLKLDAISFDERNQAYVYMQAEDGSMEQVMISTGVSNGNYVEITEGLQSGDVVYVETEIEETNAVASLLSGIFGGQQINGGSGGGRNRRENMDFGSFDFSNMPTMPGGSGGGTGGGNRPSGTGGGGR